MLRHGKDLAGLRETLARSLETNALVLSEEMISVSARGITWREKFSNLRAILDGFDYEILVTVREPAAALFSYYCEVYPTLGMARRSFLDCALQHEAMEIYHYGKLIAELDRHFAPERLHFYRFEDLVANGPGELAVLVTGRMGLVPHEPLGNRNQRSKTEGHVVTRHWFTVEDLLLSLFPSLRAPVKGSALKKIARLFRFGRRLRLRRIVIGFPEPDEMVRLREYLHSENRVLEQRFGLNY